ncbi:MAG: transposase [Thaumarchaeota archaeon]|nr:transposase [Nitrososphaerota archaeon]
MRRARARTEACEFGLDHVHLFVSGCRKCSVPYMAQRLKGASAYAIRHRLRDRVRGKLWGDPFWSDGYFYRSVGSTRQKPYGAEQPEEEALAASGRVKICAPGGERQQADRAGRFQLDPTGFNLS